MSRNVRTFFNHTYLAGIWLRSRRQLIWDRANHSTLALWSSKGPSGLLPHNFWVWEYALAHLPLSIEYQIELSTTNIPSLSFQTIRTELPYFSWTTLPLQDVVRPAPFGVWRLSILCAMSTWKSILPRTSRSSQDPMGAGRVQCSRRYR